MAKVKKSLAERMRLARVENEDPKETAFEKEALEKANKNSELALVKEQVGDKSGASLEQVGDKSGASLEQVGDKLGASLEQVGDKSGASLEQVGDKPGATQGQPRGNTDLSLKGQKVTSKEQVGDKSPEKQKSDKSRGKSLTKIDKPIRLAKKQTIVYNWFLQNGLTGEFNKGMLCRATGIGATTIRKSIDKLEELGIISLSGFDYSSRTMDYRCNTNIAVRLYKSDKSVTSIGASQGQVGDKSGASPLNSSSSSFSSLKEKTNCFDGDITDSLRLKIQNEIDSNPQLRYWSIDKLSAKQVMRWMGDYQVGFDDMIESLCHCAFYLRSSKEMDKLIGGKPIKNARNWFHSIIRDDCYYSKPDGYKTIQEERVERAKARLEEIEAAHKELAIIEIKTEQAEARLEIAEIMLDKKSDQFREFVKCVPEIYRQEVSHGKLKLGSLKENFLFQALRKMKGE